MREALPVKFRDTTDVENDFMQVVDYHGDSTKRHHHKRRGSRRSEASQRSKGDKHKRNRTREKQHSGTSISDHAGDVTRRHHGFHRKRSSRKSCCSTDDVSSTLSKRSHKHKRSSRESKSRHSTKHHAHRKHHKDYCSTPRSHSTASSSSNENLWGVHKGKRVKVLHGGFAWVQEEGEVVDYQQPKDKGGCPRIPSRYQLVSIPLMAVILACGFAFTLMGINNSNKSSESAVGQTEDIVVSMISEVPTLTPTMILTKAPTRTPYPLATRDPTLGPTTIAPTIAPTVPPTEEVVATYTPGKLTVKSNGLLLSEGLSSRIIATSGKPVPLTGNPERTQSPIDFHKEPDGAAIFPWFETGGWVYVSNSEVKDKGKGGVGALYFDKYGNVVDYQRLLHGTTMNCSGGPTPWGTWVSCEEIDGGKVFQVDPFGTRPSESVSTFGTGFFEAFAYDVRNLAKPVFYVTEDKERGPLRRIIPNNPSWEDPWELLHGSATLEYLVLEPNEEDNGNSGSYYWTTERETAKLNSQRYYKHSEGIDVHGDQLFFVSKVQKELFILNLDLLTYEVHSTVSGVFDGQPDQVKRLIHNGLLYFCEEGGKENGVHARDENGWYLTILESETLNDETTGLAFSPDGKHMYVSFQHNGLIFDIFRDDNLPFQAKTLNVKYHEIQRR